ncbi:MAG: helix-turn-helix domain-containing protein [Saprospiraceae bacterium]|nr:helix-turn-helix domain-containing protein [Saprospiraceae bacterium]
MIGAEFTKQAETIVLENISEEQFGVSELAQTMNMSRSNLLRKIKKQTGLSASQFIRQIRLQKGRELLQDTSLTVSEISFEVGFASTSYFIKCFREHYGYPPGKLAKGELTEEVPAIDPQQSSLWKYVAGLAVVAILAIFIARSLISREDSTLPIAEIEKSIAVLPFINESSDSSNMYFINGLMEATLNNLQRIEDLRVISRTSVEKYRGKEQSIPEIAEQLKVNYFVEGSGQKIGDQVLLNIQLIEAATDKHIWAEQYSREIGNVFGLQNEVAKKIAEAIEAIVTPAELEQIDKKPTENLLAYDLYLQALPHFHARTKEGLDRAIPLFKQAIEADPQFALAYANMAIAYYFLDIFQVDQQYTDLINNCADKALLYDPTSPVSLLAKAFYYIHIKDYPLALPHLEKALEYNPNSSAVVQMLTDYYSRYVPNTAKHLEYALKGVRLDIGANDSIAQSYIYVSMSHALVQTGFIEEAIDYINLSIDYYPENEYSYYLKAIILYARDLDLKQTQKRLLRELRKDTTRLDILQEVAKLYYLQENFDSAYYYFEQFVTAREDKGWNIYPQEDITIGWVYEKVGLEEEAKQFYEAFAVFCQKEQSIYRSVWLALDHVRKGEIEEAIEQLKIFADQDDFMYWFLLLENDPILKPLTTHPEFSLIIQQIKDRFWENQKNFSSYLKEEGLL